MFLFVREITGSARAGFVAGLIYAFAPYRVPQFSHLQVISSQWMPFVLYGLRRYFVTRRVRARSSAPAPRSSRRTCRTGTSCCSSRRSCSPTRSSRLRREASGATRASGWRSRQRPSSSPLLTLPFLLPYLELRRLGFGARALNEVRAFSADVFSYWTSPAESRLWGSLIRAYPKAEGDLFPSIAALLLGAVGVAGSVSLAWDRARAQPAAASRALRPIVWVLVAAAVVYAVFVLLILDGQRIHADRTVPDQRQESLAQFSRARRHSRAAARRLAARAIVRAPVDRHHRRLRRCLPRLAAFLHVARARRSEAADG